MKRLFPLFVLLPLLLSACAPVRPIRELRIVETMGCDLTGDGPALSIAAEKPLLRLTQAAPSLRLAQDRLRNQAASGSLFFAHTQFLLIGQAMAEDDLAPALDLMARSADMRLRTPLFLLKNAAAAEAVQAGDEARNVTKMLAALQEDAEAHRGETVFSCAETLSALAERGAALAAACTLEEDTLRPAGYGILKDGRCIGWIDPPEAQGADLLRGLGGHGDVRLSGATVTLSDCEAEYRPRWEGDALTGLDLTLQLRAALTETDGRHDETLRADFLDLAGQIRRGSAAKWSRIAPDWDKIWPQLAWSVTVEAALDRTLDLNEPVPPGGTA